MKVAAFRKSSPKSFPVAIVLPPLGLHLLRHATQIRDQAIAGPTNEIAQSPALSGSRSLLASLLDQLYFNYPRRNCLHQLIVGYRTVIRINVPRHHGDKSNRGDTEGQYREWKSLLPKPRQNFASF
ncbi:hypothetical protein VTK56DRAFT_2793 [Thermocarpiscus australiensis]